MNKVLIIHHTKAWEQACETFDIENVDTPATFPVLVVMNLNEDNEAMDTPVVVRPEQAAKLVASCAPERLLAMPESLRKEVHQSLIAAFGNIKAGEVTTKPLLKIPLVLAGTLSPSLPVVAIDTDGHSISYTINGFSGFKVGDKVTVDGKEFTITQVGGLLSAPDPITGQDGIVEVNDADTTPAVKLPGLNDIPLDPGKFDPKHKIADLGDPTSHVLDVERDI
jgi:hypothetical protein